MLFFKSFYVETHKCICGEVDHSYREIQEDKIFEVSTMDDDILFEVYTLAGYMKTWP